MNKQKGIIIGVLALLVTMMVGYAIFSETITINGTATAKGDFNITATCTPGFSSEIGVSKEKYISDTNLLFKKMLELQGMDTSLNVIDSENESGYKNDTCTVNSNKVVFNVDLSYPGAYRLFVVKFTNNGTIPVKVNPNSFFADMGIRDSGVSFEDYSGMDAYYQDGFNLYSYENIDFEAEAGTDSFLKINPVLEPGKSSYAVIRISWNSNDTYSNRDVDYKYEQEFLFTQSTTS